MTQHYNRVLTETLVAPPKSVKGPTKTRRVLVVSYDFPPNRTSAVYRMTGLTRSLPQYGWQPPVLTMQGGDFAQEAALLEKLPPEVEIERTKFLCINGWENKTASVIHSVGGLQSVNGKTSKPRQFDSFLRSLAALVRSTLYFP